MEAGAARLVEKLASAGLAVGRADAVVVDLAADPPLGAAQATLAIEQAERVVAGAGAALLASRARKAVIAVRDRRAERALVAAIAATGAEGKALRVVRLPEAWPTAGLDRSLGGRLPLLVDEERLRRMEAAAYSRAPMPRYVTVAGQVERPGTRALDDGLTVERLVEQAGGARCLPWAALDGGPWGGREVDPEARPRSSLLLVLSAHDPLVRRARLPLGDQLRRAASACEGCRACTEVCPPWLDGMPLEPHAIVAALATSPHGDRGTVTAGAGACLGCGVCTAACPAGLDPGAIVASVRERLPQDLPALRRGEPHPEATTRRLSVELLLRRAGLDGTLLQCSRSRRYEREA